MGGGGGCCCDTMVIVTELGGGVGGCTLGTVTHLPQVPQHTAKGEGVLKVLQAPQPCVRACVRACMCACVRVCVCVRVGDAEVRCHRAALDCCSPVACALSENTDDAPSTISMFSIGSSKLHLHAALLTQAVCAGDPIRLQAHVVDTSSMSIYRQVNMAVTVGLPSGQSMDVMLQEVCGRRARVRTPTGDRPHERRSGSRPPLGPRAQVPGVRSAIPCHCPSCSSCRVRGLWASSASRVPIVAAGRHTHGQGGPSGPPPFFLLRAALRDRPKGPPTVNCQPPPTANRHQSPTTNRHRPPTANRQPPTATNRQPHQPPTATNRQPPIATNRQSPPTMVEHLSYTRSSCKTAVPDNFFFS